jgi:hypothetical protein
MEFTYISDSGFKKNKLRLKVEGKVSANILLVTDLFFLEKTLDGIPIFSNTFLSPQAAQQI